MRELDILLMRYLDRDYPTAGPEQRAAFEALLDLQDPEILGLLTGRVGTQDAPLQDVVQRLLTNA
jgi:succinate dehydrogenase flavin-adding protein (antitoxin of CptAB toxin-antitoxin module)